MTAALVPGATPYRSAAETYWDAGWRGVLPVTGKFPPVTGWTGWAAPDPSWPDVQAWCDGPTGSLNVALRLPPNVLGIDVDAYGDKPGAATLAECEAKWGPLPATWTSTSREDGVSGIRMFLVPVGLGWPGQVGAGIETVHRAHRYVMCWPSTHPSGKVYVWHRPDGVVSIGDTPRPQDLAVLPDTWVQGLSKGPSNRDPKVDISPAELFGWVVSTKLHDGPMCPEMGAELAQIEREMKAGGSRHEAVLKGSLALSRLGDQGHLGLGTALVKLRGEFLAAISTDRADAAGEFNRMVLGAVGIVTGTPDTRWDIDPCIPPRAMTPVMSTAMALERAAVILSPDPDAALPAPPAPVVVDLPAWEPVGLDALLSSEGRAAMPTELRRQDETPLLYPGAINGLLGPSESGKTWIALLGVKQALQAGRRVVMFDFEDTASGIIDRLRSLGVKDDEMRSGFRYASPDVPLDATNIAAMNGVLNSFQPALIVLDGVNAAMTVMGLDLVSNKDATDFYQRVLRPMTLQNAAVLYIDHITKNNQEATKGGIGAQAKRAMTTGVALRVDVQEPFSRQHAGKLTITVDKDRPGSVRAISGSAQVVGTAHLDPSRNGEQMVVWIALEQHDSSPELARGSHLRQRIIGFLTTSGPSSLNLIEEACRGVPGASKVGIREMVDVLTRERVVKQESGPRRAVLCSLIDFPSTSGQWGVTGDIGEGGSNSTSPSTSPLPCPPPGDGECARAWASVRPPVSLLDLISQEAGENDPEFE